MGTTVTIEPDVHDVLSRVVTDGSSLQITQQLDRKLYVRVAKILELLGGKWNKKAKAILFDEDVDQVLADALAQGHVVDTKKLYQEYDSPADLAARLVELGQVDPGDLVLEPSAGSGRIVKAIHDARARAVVCEINPKWVPKLRATKGVDVLGADFLATEPGSPGLVDVVIANPPFTRGQDVRHVQQMAKWRPARGRIVSVMSPAWTFHTSKLHQEFRGWLRGCDHEWTPLPEGTFRESGTDVRAGVLVLDLPDEGGISR